MMFQRRGLSSPCFLVLSACIFLISIIGHVVTGFVVVPTTTTTTWPLHRVSSPWTFALQAKKKGRSGGKGFGKTPSPETPSPTSDTNVPLVQSTASTTGAQPPPPQTAGFLQNVESGGSTAIPTITQTQTPPPTTSSESQQELPAEERAKKLLLEKYGLRTLEQQRMEESLQAQRKKLDELKQAAAKNDDNNDLDVMALLPAPLLKGIDTFLKLGVGICTILFITAGLGITAEAWSKTSGNPLPDNIDQFIVQVVEPNFTTGLLVLLGFSVSLGGFAALQLGSASSQYKEK